MKLGIIGSRGFSSYSLLRKVIEKYLIVWDISHIVSGGARGADTLAEQFANEYNKEKIIHYADWSKGKGAGFTRNHEIWKSADVVVAFWDGESKGTKHSFELSKKYQKDFLVVEYISKKVYWFDWGKSTRPELGETIASIKNKLANEIPSNFY
jgi:hypothetical protein